MYAVLRILTNTNIVLFSKDVEQIPQIPNPEPHGAHAVGYWVRYLGKIVDIF